jgi:uncharacterized protein
MRIQVIAKTKARTANVEKIDGTTLKVSVHEAPVDGKANAAIIALLSDYYSLPKNCIRLIAGETSKHKYFEIVSGR